jgi:hypothetical protein
MCILKNQGKRKRDDSAPSSIRFHFLLEVGSRFEIRSLLSSATKAPRIYNTRFAAGCVLPRDALMPKIKMQCCGARTWICSYTHTHSVRSARGEPEQREGCETTTIWTADCCRFHALIYIHTESERICCCGGFKLKIESCCCCCWRNFPFICISGLISFVVFRPQGVRKIKRSLSLSHIVCSFHSPSSPPRADDESAANFASRRACVCVLRPGRHRERATEMSLGACCAR